MNSKYRKWWPCRQSDKKVIRLLLTVSRIVIGCSVLGQPISLRLATCQPKWNLYYSQSVHINILIRNIYWYTQRVNCNTSSDMSTDSPKNSVCRCIHSCSSPISWTLVHLTAMWADSGSPNTACTTCGTISLSSLDKVHRWLDTVRFWESQHRLPLKPVNIHFKPW